MDNPSHESPRHLNQNFNSEFFNRFAPLPSSELPGIFVLRQKRRTRHKVASRNLICSVALDASFSCNSTQTILGRRHFGIRCMATPLRIWTYLFKVWSFRFYICYWGLGSAFYRKYFSRIDKLFARCYKLGYCLKQHSILDIRRNRDMKLWQRISSFTNTALSDVLPPQRTQQLRRRKMDVKWT